MLGLPCLLTFCPGSPEACAPGSFSSAAGGWPRAVLFVSVSHTSLGAVPTSLPLSLPEKRFCVTAPRDSLCTKLWICAKGWFLSDCEIGLVPLALSIWIPWNFAFFHNFKLVLHPWMADWFVNTCPGFPGESVCPAVPVMLTVFCAIGKKQGGIWKSLRLAGVVKLFSISRLEIRKEPAFINYFSPLLSICNSCLCSDTVT